VAPSRERCSDGGRGVPKRRKEGRQGVCSEKILTKKCCIEEGGALLSLGKRMIFSGHLKI